MPGLGRRDNRHERKYVIAYVRQTVHGTKTLYDSARTLDDAVARSEARLSKRHNRGEAAEIYIAGKLVATLTNPAFGELAVAGVENRS